MADLKPCPLCRCLSTRTEVVPPSSPVIWCLACGCRAPVDAWQTRAPALAAMQAHLAAHLARSTTEITNLANRLRAAQAGVARLVESEVRA